MLTRLLLAGLGLFVLAHLAAIAFLMARRAWIYWVRPKSLQGSDRFMLRYIQKSGRRSYGYITVSFGTSDLSTFRARIAELRRNLAALLEDPRSAWRRGVDPEREAWVWRHELTVDTLVDDVADDEAFYALSDPARREMVVRVHEGRQRIGMLFDHTCWDGIGMLDECLAPLAEAKPFPRRWLVRARYLPLLTELMVVYTFYRNTLRGLTYRPIPPYPRGHPQTVVRHRWATSEVKALKNRLEVSFSAALVALYGATLLRWLPHRPHVRIGVVVGFVNPRHRNNYSMLAVDVHRHHDLDTSVRHVARQMKRRRIEVLGLYHLVNTVAVERSFKANVVDALFSPAFFEPDEGLSVHVSDVAFINVPTSSPLYTFACGIGEDVTLCTTCNSPAVDRAALTDGAREVLPFDGRYRLAGNAS